MVCSPWNCAIRDHHRQPDDVRRHPRVPYQPLGRPLAVQVIRRPGDAGASPFATGVPAGVPGQFPAGHEGGTDVVDGHGCPLGQGENRGGTPHVDVVGRVEAGAEPGDRGAVHDGVDLAGERVVPACAEAEQGLADITVDRPYPVPVDLPAMGEADQVVVGQLVQQGLADHAAGAGEQDGMSGRVGRVSGHSSFSRGFCRSRSGDSPAK